MKTLPVLLLLALAVFPSLVSAQAPAPAPAPAAPAAAPAPPPVTSPEVLPDRRVTFRLPAPKAGEVTLNGDWIPKDKPKLSKDAKGIWSITVGPFTPDTYIYSYNVDGVAMPDPHNPAVKLRATSPGSFVVVPGAEPGFADAKDVPHGTMEINWQKSAVLGDTRAVWIYTPPGYAKDKKKYPVLYLLHGRNGTAADWPVAGAANFILDNLLAEKKAVPMIVVMPWGHALPFEAPSDKNAAAMENYLLKDVIPMVEAKYRVQPNRASRAIFGLSMGGAHAVEIGLRHQELFSQIGSYSAGAPPGEVDTLVGPALEKPELINKQLKLFWIGCGRQDSLFARNEAFAKKLDDLKIKHTFHATDGFHNWAIWRRYLHESAPLMFR
ncbi:MAG TPA: alpha/beta hydrolase-fold protein [Polyangia bacterium]|jgi:enterochelin esterase family protein